MVRASCLPNMCCTVSLGSKCEVSITLCFCPNICKIVTPYRLSWTVWLVPLWQQCLKTLLCLVSALPGCRLAVFSTQYFLCLDLIGLPWDPYTNSNRKVCDVDVTVTFLGRGHAMLPCFAQVTNYTLRQLRKNYCLYQIVRTSLIGCLLMDFKPVQQSGSFGILESVFILTRQWLLYGVPQKLPEVLICIT